MGEIAVMQIAPDQGAFMTLLCRLDRRPRGARARHLHRLLGDLHRPRARARRPADRLRALRGVRGDRGRATSSAAGVADRVEIRIGPALETLRALPEREAFDFAFIDADKAGYPDYYEQVLARLRPGGLIVVDNVLAGGRRDRAGRRRRPESGRGDPRAQRPDRRRRARRRGDGRRSPTGSRSPASDEPRAWRSRSSAAACATGSRCSARARRGPRPVRARRGDRRGRPRAARSARSSTRSPTPTPARLPTPLDELAAAYERAGVAAWTVWVPEFDPRRSTLLEAAGHKLDGAPMAMSLELADFEPPELGDLDWDRDVDPADLGRINDLAYGLPPTPASPPG